MLAALTGALAASSLGIAGTIIGTAVMSLASTVGASVYKHYITRSNKRLRAAAAGLAPLATPSAVATAVARHHAAERAQGSPDRTRVDDTQRYPVRGFGAPPEPAPGFVSPDATETQVIPPLHMNGDLAATRTSGVESGGVGSGGAGSGGAGSGGAGSGGAGSGAAATVRDVGSAAQGDGTGQVTGAEPIGAGGSDDGAGQGTAGDWTWPWSRRQWIMVAATALGVFVVAMAAVTVFEVAVGKPLDAVVWHKHASGTTLGGLIGGSGGHHRQPSHSPSPSHSPRPGHSPSSSPSPTTSSTAPSTSPTPSSSTTPSTGASSPAATNSAPAQTAAPGASSPSG
jgi:hypothetical protein